MHGSKEHEAENMKRQNQPGQYFCTAWALCARSGTACKCSKSQVGMEGYPGNRPYRPRLMPNIAVSNQDWALKGTKLQSPQLLFGYHPLSLVGVLLHQPAGLPFRFGSPEGRHPQALVYPLPHGMTIPAPLHWRAHDLGSSRASDPL